MRWRFRLKTLLLIGFASVALGCASGASHSEVTRTRSAPAPGLTGEWVVTKQNISPLLIGPLCKPIKQGTTFKFTEKTLEIYLSASTTPCSVYEFKVANNTISFIKSDMIWLCTYELASNSLKLISNSFFTYEVSATSTEVNKEANYPKEIKVVMNKK